MSLNLGAALVLERCNPYGAESGGAVMLGGLSPDRVKHQWYCKKRATATYFMECAHGHKGQRMPLCEFHARQFARMGESFCPRCNIPPGDHRCQLSLKEVS